MNFITSDPGLSLEAGYLLDLTRAWAPSDDTLPAPPPDLNWGQLVEEAVKQKLLPWVCGIFVLAPPSSLPRRLSHLMADILALNRHRNGVKLARTQELQASLGDIGLSVAARKGALFDEELYGGGLRTYGDIDLYIKAQDIPLAIRTFEVHGWKQGTFDRLNRRVKDLPREEVVLTRVRPDHLPRLVLEETTPLVGATELDICFDFLWYGSEFQTSGRAILDEAMTTIELRTACGLMAFDPAYNLIDAMLHLFREAYFERSILQGHDVSLSKFLDVRLLWLSLSPPQRERFDHLVQRFGLWAPIAWVAAHTDAVLGTFIATATRLGPGDAMGLPSYRTSQGHDGIWRGSMISRIFASDRLALFEGLSR